MEFNHINYKELVTEEELRFPYHFIIRRLNLLCQKIEKLSNLHSEYINSNQILVDAIASCPNIQQDYTDWGYKDGVLWTRVYTKEDFLINKPLAD